MNGYQNAINHEVRYVLPQVADDLEDFIRLIQTKLPPPTDVAYWDKVRREREIRIAQAQPAAAQPVQVVAPAFTRTDIREESPVRALGPGGPLALSARRQTALVIGVNDYEHWPRLVNAVPDARAVAQILREQYGFTKTTELLDNQATRHNIFEELRTAVEAMKGGEDVLIYFSGHGSYDDTLKRGYWIPVDARSEDDLIPNTEIHAYIKAMDGRGAGHVFLIADSCFSGSLIELQRGVGGVRRPDGSKPEAVASFISKAYASPARLALTSGSLEPVADGGADGHSYFASQLLQALKTPEYPVFTATELAVGVQKVVGWNSKQAPQFGAIYEVGHKGGDFVFVKKE